MPVTAENRPSKTSLSVPKPPPQNTDIDKALREIGRAKRRKDVDGRVTSLVRAHAEHVLIRAATLNQSRENHAARNMIRFDLLPKNCDVAKLKELVKNNEELTRYVSALEERMNLSVDRLDAEEVLRLDSNLFTRRLLKTQGKLDALEKRLAEPATQHVKKEKPTAEARSRYATWRQAGSPANRNMQQDDGAAQPAATAYGKQEANAVAVMAIAAEACSSLDVPSTPVLPIQDATPSRTANDHAGTALKQGASVIPNFMPSHYPPGKEPVSARAAAAEMAGRADTKSAASLAGGVTVALDVYGCPADPEPPFAPHIDWKSSTPTIDADYKNKGWFFQHLGKRNTSLRSEERRFEQALEAFIKLLDVRLEGGQTKLFKHMPDLVHRLFTTPGHREDNAEELLEQMREGLRGGGNRLTPTAQKLLAWLAIVWDDSCLKLDDPAKVQMRERDGQFEVLERDANGHENWRAARTGTLDLAYTTSLIGSWFKHPKALRFDKAALQHIGVRGPLYRSRDGRVEFVPGATLSMGKKRLRSLDVDNLLHLSALDSLRSVVHGQRTMEPITLAIDLDTLSPAPLGLGNLTEFVWGETHGNTALELYALHAVGMIRIKSSQGWQAIRNAIATADYRNLDTLLATHIEHGPHATGRTFVLQGNTLAGPMGNDLIELQVRAFLRDDMKIDMPELQSAHNAYFDAYWKLNQDKGLTKPFEFPANPALQQAADRLTSLQQMHRMMNSEDEQVRREVRLLLKKYTASYYKDDRLQLCRVAEDGRTLLTGGRVNQETSRALAAQINADGFRVRTNLSAKAQANDSNAWFRNAVLTLDVDAYLAATQCVARNERGGAGAVGNPLAAYLGRYDASPFFPGTILDRGIDRNVSGQSNRIDACWQLHGKFQPTLMKWLFEPFEDHVDAVKPDVSIAPTYASATGTRLFWRNGLVEHDIEIFDKLIANCMYEVPHDASLETLERFATYILALPHAKLMERLGSVDSPQRTLLASLKENIVESLKGIREPLRAWDRTHSVKSMTTQQLADEALAQLDALPTTPEEIDALSREDLVELLFSGATARLFNYARMTVDLTQSSQRNYAQTRIALNGHGGSEPQHRQFTRTFFGF